MYRLHTILFFLAITSTTHTTDLQVLNADELFIDSNGSKLFCRTIGEGNPLVVIHGGPGSGQDYLLPQCYALAKNNFVIFYDQRGAGKSTGEINDASMSITMFIRDLEAIRNAFNFDKLSLLGHSWGAFVAMHYALEYPEHVDKLILSSPCPASSDDFSLLVKERTRRLLPFQEEVTKIQNTEDYQNGDPDLYEQVLRLMVRVYCHTPADADLVNIRINRSAVINATKIRQIIYANILEKPFDLHERLKTLRIPTLVVHGENDVIPLSTAQHIHESILRSKYVVLPNCGHYPYVEQPALYFQAIDDFLR